MQAVIFDVDGTLVDSNDLHVDAWREAFSRYGKTPSREAIHAQIGKGGDQLIPVFCSPEEVERFGEELDHVRGEIFMRKYLDRTKPFARVRELFERIKADGLRIALASSAKKQEIEHHEKNLGIEGLFDVATSADDAEHSKPCPDIFEAALKQLGVRAEDAIVIGDSPYDVKAAARAGMKTICVLSGGFDERELRAAGAIAIYKDVADLLAHYDESPLAHVHDTPAQTNA